VNPTVAVEQTGHVGFGVKLTVLIICAIAHYKLEGGVNGWHTEETGGKMIPLEDKTLLLLNWELIFSKNSLNWVLSNFLSFVIKSDLSDSF